MIKNYFKTAWRNIIRGKGYSALNIFGLATGMAVTFKRFYPARFNKLFYCISRCFLFFNGLAAEV